MKAFQAIRGGILRYLKRHGRLDGAVCRLRHPFGGDRLDALEEAERRQRPVLAMLQENLKALADAVWSQRMRLKVQNGMPAVAVFVCHEPAIWPMHETIYQAMARDRHFDPVVVAMPNTQFGAPVDKGMRAYCADKGIRAVEGYDPRSGTWLDPMALAPDYVFFQTPYDFFPDRWSVGAVAQHAKIVYVDYATTVLRDSGDHPEAFLRHASYIFEDNEFAKRGLAGRLGDRWWYKASSVIVSGSPKHDYFSGVRKAEPPDGCRNRTSLLWTPRWRTEEGACHFFTYKDYFAALCARRKDVRLVFRPHPLCFLNFLKTGEMTERDHEVLRRTYAESENMALDEGPDYRAAVLGTDILITDVSSMIAEYMPTGKPVIYTHRVDLLNDYARRLAEGCYWVRNEAELDATIGRLLDGQDPLRDKRREISDALYCFPKGGSGEFIKEILRKDSGALAQPGRVPCGA